MSCRMICLCAAGGLAMFAAGFCVQSWRSDARQADQVRQYAQEIERLATVQAELKDENLRAVNAAEKKYQELKDATEKKQPDIIARINAITDSVRSAETRNTESASDNTAADISRIKLRNARLYRALRIALDGNREDAQRADQYAGQLNLCIEQLRADREQVEKSR